MKSVIKSTFAWIHQAVMTVIFGPMVPILFRLMADHAPELRKLHHQFFYATILVGHPVLTAAIIYLQQHVALYEITYIYYLTTMQFLALLATALSGAVFHWGYFDTSTYQAKDFRLVHHLDVDVNENSYSYEREQKNWKQEKSFAWIATFACIIGFGLYLGSLHWIQATSLALTNVQALIAQCTTYGEIVPPKVSYPVGAKIETGFAWGYIFLLLVGPISIALFSRIHVWRRLLEFMLVNPVSNFLITLGFAAGMLYCLARMQRDRILIRALAGPEFQDDRWGFGQVMAPFIWITQSLAFLKWLLAVGKFV